MFHVGVRRNCGYALKLLVILSKRGEWDTRESDGCSGNDFANFTSFGRVGLKKLQNSRAFGPG